MRKRVAKFVRAIAVLALLGTPTTNVVAQTAVDLELALLVDVSGSVSTTEFNLQMDGYSSFFSSANSAFWDAYEASNRTMAASFVQWSSGNNQSQLGGLGSWYYINSAASAYSFGTAIDAFSRAFDNNTAPGSAINFIVPQFGSNTYVGTRKVIDVSGDGCQNTGASTSAARTAAAALGITINGITIGNGSDCPQSGQAAFAAWYAANVITDDGFLIQSADFETFGTAVATKIGREVTGEPGDVVPEPATMTLLATGLAGMAAARRRKQQKLS